MPSRKKIPSRPRFKSAKIAACVTLLKSGTNRLPIDVFNILQTLDNVLLITVTQYAQSLNISYDQALYKIRSKDGISLYLPDKDLHIVVYNDQISHKKRVRWTLAHELGHIILNHAKRYDITELNRGGIPSKEYNVLEGEADFFARFLLGVPIILNQIGISTVEQVSNLCDLSYLASVNLLNYYNQKWMRYPITKDEYRLVSFFSAFLSNKEYYKFIYNQCKKCHTKIESSDKYCKICGKELVFDHLSISNNKKGVGLMIYPGIVLDANFKAVVCPICNNSQTDIDTEFCHICGTCIINKCTGYNCNRLLVGNARYCDLCGRESTFFRSKILMPWDFNEQVATTSNYVDDDDDLPF